MLFHHLRGLLISIVIFAVGLFSLPGSCHATEPETLPAGVQSLPAALEGRMRELIKIAEKYRGLSFLQPVPSGTLGEDGLRQKMLEMFQDELPEEKMNPLEASLKAFNFIPQELVLSKYYPELLTGQVGGFYDPKKKYLVLVQREGGLLGKEARDKIGADLANRMEETVLVHELTHALQDQHFDLQHFAINDPLSDEGVARTALVEGDATLTMYDFLMNMRLENFPGIEQLMGQMMKDPKQLIDLSPDMPGSKQMSEAPAWFRDNLLFSYLQGFVFCINVRKLGGQKLLDHAFKKDPPRSSEQILHPEKWHTRRDDPVVIGWPDLARELPGHKKIAEGQLGELSIKILLNERLKKEDAAAVAAAGWGGDRFAVYEKDGGRVLVWITEWDSEKDGEEFRVAAKSLGEDWVVTSLALRRVELVHGPLKLPELGALTLKLATVKSEQPANLAMDLAGLGIAAGGNRALAEEDDLLGELGKMIGEKDGASGMDLSALLKDPQLQKMAESLLAGDGEKLGITAGGGDLDIKTMLKDPQMQAMVKAMMSQERPAGKASVDGQMYTNEQLGFSIKLPPSGKGWKLDAKPPIPMTSVLIGDAFGVVEVSVATQKLPMVMPIGSLGPMLEMGPKMVMPDFKKISGGLIQTGTHAGYELQYQGTMEGTKHRIFQRFFSSGTTMIVLSAKAPPESWAENEKAILETIESFSFTDLK